MMDSNAQKQSLKNLNAILVEAGTSIQNAVKVTIFVTSMDHYTSVNKAYLEVFSGDPKPVCLNYIIMRVNRPSLIAPKRVEHVLRHCSSLCRGPMSRLN